MSILWYLAGFLPFVSWGRVAPIGSFWPQWGAATIFLIIGMAQFLKNRNRLEFAGRSSFDGAVILLFLSISAQILTGHVYSKTSAFIAVGALALGWIFTKVSTLAVVRDPTRSLDVWCMGVSAALLFQAFVVGLGVFGKEFVHGFLFDAPPQLRALGAFGQSNHLGVFSVLALACLHHLFAKRRITPWMLWGGVAISALVCALSYSRAALLVWGALAVIAAIPLWKSRRRGDDEKKVWHAHVYVCVFFLTVQMLNFMVPLMPLISGMQDGPSLLADNRAMSSNARLEQIRDSFQLIEKYPYFGVGYEGFAGARLRDLSGSLMEPQTTVPHNLLLQFFVEFGLIGALIDLWMIFAVFKVVRLALLDSENFSSDRLLAVQWIVGLFVYSMFEFPLLYSYFLLPFLMMAGLAGYPIVSVGVGRPLKIALTSALVFGFIGLFLIACDYQRMYNFFHGKNKSSLMDLAQIQTSSVFQFHANSMWLNVIALNDAFVEEKLQVADFVLRGVPQYQTISKYIAYLVLSKKEKEALDFLEDFSRRDLADFKAVVFELNRLAATEKQSHAIWGFLQSPSMKILVEQRAAVSPMPPSLSLVP